MYRYAGNGITRRFGVHNNSLHNIQRGLTERVFRVERNGILVPPPTPASYGMFSQRLAKFDKALRPVPLRPLSDSQFCERYQGRKRLVYEAAAASLLTKPVNKRDSHMKTFVKAEKLDLKSKPDPAPRVIQPRDPRYNVEVGKLISHQEKRLFRCIDRIFGKPTVMKGHDCLKTGEIFAQQWGKFYDPVAVGMDASRFDQHVSEFALGWEHKQWLKFVPKTVRKKLKKLLRWQMDNQGVAYAQGGRIKYRVKARRMSGDMNTSSGNIMIMCALVYAYLTSVGLTTADFWLANNGDDSTIVLDRKNLHKLSNIPKWFLEMGFNMKIEDPVYHLEQIEFCQTHPVWTERGWTMVRDPHKALGKDCTVNCDIKGRTHRETWIGAVREGGLALTDGCPVWPAFYSMFVAGTTKVTKNNNVHEHVAGTGFRRLAGSLKFVDIPISAKARCSFWIAFGITPDEQEAIEARFRTITYTSELEPLGQWSHRSELVLPHGL